MVVADFDRDGQPDIASLNLTDSTVKIDFGGTRSISVAIGSGTPVTLTAAELQHDGQIDLVVGMSDGKVRIFRNAAGAFPDAPEEVDLGLDHLTAVALGDLDRDGFLDLIGTDGLSDVAVALSDGLGSFGGATSYSDPNTAQSPVDVAVADVDGDGALDLVTANGAGSINVFLNDGSGLFTANAAITTSTQTPTAIAIGDVDGDGKPDLVTIGTDSTAASAGSVNVMLNTGGGTFASPAVFQLLDATTRVALGDLTHNGHLQIVLLKTALGCFSTIEPHVSAGVVTLEPEIVTSISSVGSSPVSMAVADLDRDGRLDVVAANTGTTPNVAVRFNNSANTTSSKFLPAVIYDETGGPSIFGVVAADLDGDGKVDLAAAETYFNANGTAQASGFVRVIFNQGAGSFPPTAIRRFQSNNGEFLAAGDFDGDGKIDLVVSDTSDTISTPAQILTDIVNGTFTTIPGNYFGKPLVADFDRDGKLDIAFSGDGPKITVVFGNGDGTFGTDVAYGVGKNPGIATVGDVNGDGFPDLLVPNFGDDNVTILLNDRHGDFNAQQPIIVGDGPHQVVVGDFNRDGKLDFATVNVNSGKVSVVLGKGDGTFAKRVDYTVGAGPLGLTVADLNGDGKLDIATANTNNKKQNSGGTLSVLFGFGDGKFAKAISIPTSTFSGPGQIVSADLDGDGQRDLVAANINGGNFAVVLHVGSPLPAPTGFTVTVPTIVKSGSQWKFTVTQGSTAPGVTVRIQASTAGGKAGSWIDVPASVVKNGNVYTFTSSKLPGGTVVFRVVTAAPGYTENDFLLTTPKSVKIAGLPKTSKLTVLTETPAKVGNTWVFGATNSASPTKTEKDGSLTFPNLRMRVQSTETPNIEGSWTDLPDDGFGSGGAMIQLGSKWGRITTNIPLGHLFFRAITSADGYAADVSVITDPPGPFIVREASGPTVFGEFVQPAPSIATIVTGEVVPVKIGVKDDNGLQHVFLQFSTDGAKWTNAGSGNMSTTGDGVYTGSLTFGSAGLPFSANQIYFRVAAVDNDTPANTSYSKSVELRIGVGGGAAGPTYGVYSNAATFGGKTTPATNGATLLTGSDLTISIPIGDDKQVKDAFLERCDSNGDYIDFVRYDQGIAAKMYQNTRGNLAVRFDTVANLADGTYYFRVIATDFDGNLTASPITGPYTVSTPLVVPTVTVTVRAGSKRVGPSYNEAALKKAVHPDLFRVRPDQGVVKVDFSGLPTGGASFLVVPAGQVDADALAVETTTTTAGSVILSAPKVEGDFEIQVTGTKAPFKGTRLHIANPNAAKFTVGHSWQTVDTFTSLDYGLYWFKDDHNALRAVPGQDDDYFSPSRPTVIYVHGWQPDELKVKRRESWTRGDGPDSKQIEYMAQIWKDKGYNVGLFYWNQFANSGSVNLPQIEAKMYRTTGVYSNEAPGRAMDYALYSATAKDHTENYYDTTQFATVNVTDLFYTAYTENLVNYVPGPTKDLRLIGHSLGTQLIARTMALVAQYNPPNVPLPQRIALFDPAYVSIGTRDNQVGYISTLSTAGVAIEVYQSTNLQTLLRLFGNDPSPVFDQCAYQRISPDWLPNPVDSHGEPIRWYSLSMKNPAFGTASEPPAYDYFLLSRTRNGNGISAATSTSRIRTFMSGGANAHVYFNHIDGKGTTPLGDDGFERKSR